MSKKKILIDGSGIVGLTTAKLCLDNQDCEVAIIEDYSGFKPTILINDDCKFILSSIWKLNDKDWSFFESISFKQHFINSIPNSIPFVAIVLNPEQLSQRLFEQLFEQYSDRIKVYKRHEVIANAYFDWEFQCSFYDSEARKDKIKFGQRNIYAATVNTSTNLLKNTCSLLSTSGNTWAFIFPFSPSIAVVQIMSTHFSESVIENVEAQLKYFFGNSLKLSDNKESFTKYAAYPWIRKVFHDGNGIYVGSAAVSYDPICGDGLGNSLRSSILATSIVSANENEQTQKDMLQYYTQRLTANFISHIKTCLNFYSQNQSWKAEVDSMKSELKNLMLKPIETENEYFLENTTLRKSQLTKNTLLKTATC